MNGPRLLVLLAALSAASDSFAWQWPAGAVAKGAPPQVSTNCEDLSAEPINYGMQYEIPGSGLPETVIDMQDIWASGGCLGCHNVTAMGGLRLDQPEFGGYQIVLAASFRNPNILRAVPNDPENSLLYSMLNCSPPIDYPVMPPPVDGNTVRIQRRLRAMVYDWIEQGARGFDGDGNPYSDVLFRDSTEGERLQKNLAVPPPPGAR